MSGVIAIVVPVLGRPDRVRPLMENVQRNTKVDHRLLFVATPGDHAELAELESANADYTLLGERHQRLHIGDYAKKINLGYRFTSEPYIFTGADDLVFHRGWDEAALCEMVDRIGVVGTQDLGNAKVIAGEHSTHSLVSREYADRYGTIDEPGKIYCELYHHEFVDDELIGTAKFRDAFAFAHDSVVEHIHPHWGKRDEDHLTRNAPRRLAQGRRIYKSRKHMWERVEDRPTVPVSVLVATYGDKSWISRGSIAMSNIRNQRVMPFEVAHYHGKTLADARNRLAEKSASPWLCFLDADDELDSRYFEHMAPLLTNPLFLLTPAVQFVKPEGAERPKSFNTRDLRRGNYLVIGTLIHRDLFFATGGFDPRWRAYEDWAMWWKAVELGGRVIRVPKAIYRAFWRPDGRNNTIDDAAGLCDEIRAEHDAWMASR